MVAQELKRKGVTLTLLWQEYRAAHPDGYGYTWFCETFGAYSAGRTRHSVIATRRGR